jgi:hypothetical protein
MRRKIWYEVSLGLVKISMFEILALGGRLVVGWMSSSSLF